MTVKYEFGEWILGAELQKKRIWCLFFLVMYTDALISLSELDFMMLPESSEIKLHLRTKNTYNSFNSLNLYCIWLRYSTYCNIAAYRISCFSFICNAMKCHRTPLHPGETKFTSDARTADANDVVKPNPLLNQFTERRPWIFFFFFFKST